MPDDQKLRDQLVKLMKGGNAFFPLPEVLDSTPYEITSKKPEGFVHTIWEITEHIRICLHDLVEYSKSSYFQSPPWPEGYWPKNTGPESKEEWESSVGHIKALLEEMIDMVLDSSNDLFKPFAANPDHNLLRQATIVAEHNAYHNGQIVLLRKALGSW